MTLPTDWLTIPQAAAAVGVSAETVRCLCHRREIRHIKTGTTGRAIRIRREWLREYLDANEVAPSDDSRIAAAARKRAAEGAVSGTSPLAVRYHRAANTPSHPRRSHATRPHQPERPTQTFGNGLGVSQTFFDQFTNTIRPNAFSVAA